MAIYKGEHSGYHNSIRSVGFTMHIRNKVLILTAAFVAYSLTEISASFYYANDLITSTRDDGSIPEDYLKDDKLRVAKRYYRDFVINVSDSIFTRVKRNDDSTFIGHPKTREERWHSNFNLNQTNQQVDQAQSLVNLLVKVMDKYLNSCIPIILYDNSVATSEGIILQTFFKVLSPCEWHNFNIISGLCVFFLNSNKFQLFVRQAMKISYLHGIISDNYTVVNQNLLQPYDKNCRSYFLFLSDVLRTRDVLGPQTENRVVLIARSTQWKLQEFLASKEANDIVNLLVIGESVTSDPSKVANQLH